MTLWDYLPQQQPVPPFWIAAMHASISKNDTRNVQRTPYGRFIHLPRLSASFWSLKCQIKGNVYCYVSFFALLIHSATAPRGVQVTTCTLSEPYHSHTSSNVVIHSIRHIYIL